MFTSNCFEIFHLLYITSVSTAFNLYISNVKKLFSKFLCLNKTPSNSDVCFSNPFLAYGQFSKCLPFLFVHFQPNFSTQDIPEFREVSRWQNEEILFGVLTGLLQMIHRKPKPPTTSIDRQTPSASQTKDEQERRQVVPRLPTFRSIVWDVHDVWSFNC